MRIVKAISFCMLIGIATVALTVTSATAAIITLTAQDQGFYRSDGRAGTTVLPNYLVGLLGSLEHRNFFIFDLSSTTDTIVSATLNIFNPINGFRSDKSQEIYKIVEVTGSIDMLAAGTGGISAFNDLGSGSKYFSIGFGTRETDKVISIRLFGNALTNLNSGASRFALGGHLISILGDADQYIFGFTGDVLGTLTLETSSITAIPLPAALPLFLTGLAGIGLLRRRQRQRQA